MFCPDYIYIRNPALPMDLGNKKGDWLCIQCNFVIFGRKDKCYKCGRKKGDNSSIPVCKT